MRFPTEEKHYKTSEMLQAGFEEETSSFSILSDDRFKASSKTIPPYSAI
jgi:hypothetical protein